MWIWVLVIVLLLLLSACAASLYVLVWMVKAFHHDYHTLLRRLFPLVMFPNDGWMNLFELSRTLIYRTGLEDISPSAVLNLVEDMTKKGVLQERRIVLGEGQSVDQWCITERETR